MNKVSSTRLINLLPLMSCFRRSLLLVAGLFSLGLVAQSRAADTNLGMPAGSVAVPTGLSKSDVQQAIIATLAGRGWSIQEKNGEKVVGYLKHRSNEATVTLLFDDKKVDLFCVGYEIDKSTGVHKKPEMPNGWLGNIRTDLNKRMNQATAKK
jgi:hypothetical protein